MTGFPKRAILILVIGITVVSCARNHRSTIVGNWSGENVTITKGNETISVPIEKYGYLNLVLNRDSTYTLSLGVLKDVRVEKKVFGVNANTVLIPAIYKSARFGKWTTGDSGCILSSKEGVMIAQHLQDGESLGLNFTDGDGRAWSCILEPKE